MGGASRAPTKRYLNTLFETECRTREKRETIRVTNSPISVAFEDAVLRAEGMKGDSYGEAKRFFGISDQQLHYIVCYCHSGATMSAEVAALRVRHAAASAIRSDTLDRMLQAFGM